MVSVASYAYASDVNVNVVDKDGRPVGDVAVYATKPGSENDLLSPTARAIMDQIDRQFVPHLLVVQTGTSVEFPNSDSVAHHVYSFSHPNKFMLPMYRGEQHPPVRFDFGGVVSLGCNIHDHMLGFILVVNSTAFTKTDEYGNASLTLDNPEDYEISIWSPRIRDENVLLTKAAHASGDDELIIEFRLEKKLNPPHDAQAGRAPWEKY